MINNVCTLYTVRVVWWILNYSLINGFLNIFFFSLQAPSGQGGRPLRSKKLQKKKPVDFEYMMQKLHFFVYFMALVCCNAA